MSSAPPNPDSLAAAVAAYRGALEAIALPTFAPRDPARPFVVALEGPNGAGKTTLAAALSPALGAARCLGTDAAWFAESFKVRMIRDADWFASAMFFLSGCCEQMRVLRGRPEPLAIMDRSLWSTLAVHAAARAERLGALAAMLRPVAAEIPVPDFTLVLDASFATCQARIAAKSGSARALDELTANALFHAKEQAFYRWLGRAVPGVAFLNVDELNAAQVADRASEIVRARISC